jgi:hypothetical protein
MQRRDLIEPHSISLAIHAGKKNPLARRYGMQKAGPRVDLFGKGGHVEQDSMRSGIAGKVWEPRGELGLLNGSKRWIKPQDQLPH